MTRSIVYTLSLHDALPISSRITRDLSKARSAQRNVFWTGFQRNQDELPHRNQRTVGCETGRKDRKSTRLNSSHMSISYAVFCLKKKNKYSMCDCVFSLGSF